MERPKIFPLFTQKSEFCEKSSKKPVETFIPNQSYTLSELVSRFEKGQRLPCHLNFQPGDNMTKDQLYEETFEDAPPTDVHDIVDVEQHYREHQVHKSEFNKKKKEKQAKQATPVAQQAKQFPTPQEAPAAPAAND